MKKEIHPKTKTVEVTCTTCSNKFMTTTTADEIKVDVCSKCHPFYTGKQSTGSKAGRIDKFNKKLSKKTK